MRQDSGFRKYKVSSNLTEDAKELRVSIGISCQSEVGLRELEKLQNHPSLLGKYQLNVYSTRLMGARMFRGPPGATQLNLLLHDKHYFLITSMNALFNVDNFCDKCGRPTSKSGTRHICKESQCPHCNQAECGNSSSAVNYTYCADCN